MRPRSDAADRFVLLWLLLPLLFFSTAGSKLPGYILPCLAPIALAAGRWATEMTGAEPGGHRTALRTAALVGLTAGGCALAVPFLVWRRGEAIWPLLLPACTWALLTMLLFAWRVLREPAGAFALVRLGGAGFLLLLTLVSPTVLGKRDSGRELFAISRGEPVVVWGARRAVWMTGYFYNDGKVREVTRLEDVLAAAANGPILVLCGPKEFARLERAPLSVTRLAVGARGATLIRLSLQTPAAPGSPGASAS
jgi:4-amino-4-deoxy-L-arabinose transferase-like glycosyltransferase